MKFVYVHGASATGESFNYIRDHLKNDDELVIEYSSKDGFDHNLKQMIRLLRDYDNMFFICHSLGGIYALHLYSHFNNRIKGCVSLSTPYGGSKAADYAKYFLPFSRLLRDIGPNSYPMRVADKIKINIPWTNIITTAGTIPWMIEPNDGVVTISSMKYRNDMEHVDLPLNHYEVVISPKTVNVIKEKINEVSYETMDTR